MCVFCTSLGYIWHSPWYAQHGKCSVGHLTSQNTYICQCVFFSWLLSVVATHSVKRHFLQEDFILWDQRLQAHSSIAPDLAMWRVHDAPWTNLLSCKERFGRCSHHKGVAVHPLLQFPTLLIFKGMWGFVLLSFWMGLPRGTMCRRLVFSKILRACGHNLMLVSSGTRWVENEVLMAAVFQRVGASCPKIIFRTLNDLNNRGFDFDMFA